MSVFSDFLPSFLFFFSRMHHQSVKTKQCQIPFFFYSSCKNSVWTHISIIQMHYAQTTLFCLHLWKSFSIEDHRTFSPKAMHHVCCLSWCRCILSWTGCCLVRVCFLGLAHSSSSSSVSCSHLPPTASNLPYWKMANFRKVFMQSRFSLV